MIYRPDQRYLHALIYGIDRRRSTCGRQGHIAREHIEDTTPPALLLAPTDAWADWGLKTRGRWLRPDNLQQRSAPGLHWRLDNADNSGLARSARGRHSNQQNFPLQTSVIGVWPQSGPPGGPGWLDKCNTRKTDRAEKCILPYLTTAMIDSSRSPNVLYKSNIGLTKWQFDRFDLAWPFL